MSESHSSCVSLMIPPNLPSGSIYTSCYCEENIYLLAEAFVSQAQSDEEWPWDIYAVFISNETQTVALWNQKAREDVVVWDYHVVLVLCRARSEATSLQSGQSEDAARNETWVYDFDTRLPNPCRCSDYMHHTFPYAFNSNYASQVNESYHSLFRVIPASTYLDYFASDRSHMLDDTSASGLGFKTIPPTYPALSGRKAKELGVTHNLMKSYVSMTLQDQTPSLDEENRNSDKGSHPYGEVMDITGFLRWISGGQP